jgi:predicted acylesterase/phospholipase RssA
LFIVRSGRVEVVDESAPGDGVRRVLGPGSALGEIGLLTGSPRSASVRARRDSVLLSVEAAVFDELVRRSPALALSMTRVLGRWLADGGVPKDLARQGATVLAMVPATDDVPMDLVREAMHGAVSGLGPRRQVVIVTTGSAREEAAAAGARDGDSAQDAVAVFGRLLDRWERGNDVVVLTTDADAPGDHHARAWSDFCLRSADRCILLIGPTATSRGAAQLAEQIRSHLPEHPDVCFLDLPRQSQLGSWLDALSPRAHHLVRTHAPGAVTETVNRMARRVLGRSVGVVLSGGGARGFAHLGALAALRSAGFSVDRLGGCSIGSVIGGLFAAGHSDDEVLAICRQYFVRSKPLNDYTVPRTALLQGNKLRGFLQEAFGDQLIESLPIPFFCVSSDLVRAETVVHRRGPLWTGVLASVSIPGLLPPRPLDGRLLVDGGVLNNLPIDVMADAEEGPVIAIDVMRPFGRRYMDGRAHRRLPAWATRRGRSGADPLLPPIAEVLARSTVLGSWRMAEQNRARAALTITVPDDGTGLLEWGRLDELVQAGTRAAEVALADLPSGSRGQITW